MRICGSSYSDSGRLFQGLSSELPTFAGASVLILAFFVTNVDHHENRGGGQSMDEERQREWWTFKGSVSRRVSRGVFPDVQQLYTQSALPCHIPRKLVTISALIPDTVEHRQQ